MQGASRESLAGAEDRLAGLLSQASVDAATVGDELYALTDLLDGQPALRTSLTDPARSGDDKAELVRSLLAGKVSSPTAGVRGRNGTFALVAEPRLGRCLRGLGRRVVVGCRGVVGPT